MYTMYIFEKTKRMEYHEGSITLDLDKLEENDRLKGKMYGYPQCCIDAYVETRTVGLVIDRKANNSGYRTCGCCSMKVVNGESTLSGLILDSRSSIAGKFRESWKYHGSFVNTTAENINRRR